MKNYHWENMAETDLQVGSNLIQTNRDSDPV